MDYTVKVEDLPDDRDLLIPVSVSLDGDKALITCFEQFYGSVCEYAERYSGAPLSRDALDFLFSAVDPGMKRLGYSMPDDRFEIDCVCILNAVPEAGYRNAVNAERAVDLPNLTEIDLAEAGDLHQAAFVCVEDGRVVSVAAENFAEDGCVEIACETAEAYRRKGYAYSACAALCKDIISDGYSVRWQCSEENLPSVALAKKLGFAGTGREMYMCYYDEGNGEGR